MAYAFQLDEGTSTGGYGVQPYGTSPYGGGFPDPWVLPEPQVGSSDPRLYLGRRRGVVRVERSGIVIAERTFATVGTWHFVYRHRTAAWFEQLRQFFDAGVFRFLRDTSDESTYHRVRWVQDEFEPVPVRDGYYGLAFDIEEVLS